VVPGGRIMTTCCSCNLCKLALGISRTSARRGGQGLEVDLNGRVMQRVTIGGGYTFLDATYQSTETISGVGNSSNADALAGFKGVESTIQSRLATTFRWVPSHMLEGVPGCAGDQEVYSGPGVDRFSSAYARGNENNKHVADGVYYLGPGKSGGYALLNLSGR